jgi:hypothetical protein
MMLFLGSESTGFIDWVYGHGNAIAREAWPPVSAVPVLLLMVLA